MPSALDPPAVTDQPHFSAFRFVIRHVDESEIQAVHRSDQLQAIRFIKEIGR
ncbi:hypothetical protein [Caballeronia grimmiae]|uniref:hypothetical protein n=1 Tax=Caballeronia grimmiae TaxID=1071679 RepID=UPI0038BC8B05